ncbi:MAG: hypothetical protein RLZZ196_702 [Bacteroidota bacterium]|jgi:hypothetical protein
MRTRAIVDGFKNSQKFRFILTANSGEDVGMVITVKQMSDTFVTQDARIAVWTALERLASQRRLAQHRSETLPTGLVTDAQGFRQVQVDLH